MFPDLLKGISPELRKRMQGKTCWNFTKAEESLFAELGNWWTRASGGLRKSGSAT
jgi:hypothetical protein